MVGHRVTEVVVEVVTPHPGAVPTARCPQVRNGVLVLVEEVAERPSERDRDGRDRSGEQPDGGHPHPEADQQHAGPAHQVGDREVPRRVHVVFQVFAAHDPLAVQVVHGEAVQHVLGQGPQRSAGSSTSPGDRNGAGGRS